MSARVVYFPPEAKYARPAMTLPELSIILVIIVVYVGFSLPAYIVGSRSGVSSPWIAFIPVFGVLIVLLRVIGQSAWLALLALIPYVGGLVLDIWLAFAIPKRHDRSGWWTPAFIFVPVLSWYWYALTLPRALSPEVPASRLSPGDTF